MAQGFGVFTIPPNSSAKKESPPLHLKLGLSRIFCLLNVSSVPRSKQSWSKEGQTKSSITQGLDLVHVCTASTVTVHLQNNLGKGIDHP